MNKWIIILILLSILCSGGIFYYKSTQSKIENLISQNVALIENNKTLLSSNSENLNTISSLQSTYETIQIQYDTLQSEFQLIRSQNEELKNRLGEHELDVLAANKPKLVENVINNATKNAIRCFELSSGSPLTEKEKNAKTEKEFNSECPWLFNELISN